MELWPPCQFSSLLSSVCPGILHGKMGKVSKRLQNQIDLHVYGRGICTATVCQQSVNCLLTSCVPEYIALVRNTHLLVDSGELTQSDPDLTRKKNVAEGKTSAAVGGRGWSRLNSYGLFFFFLVYSCWKNIQSLVVFPLCVGCFLPLSVTYGQWIRLENVIFGAAFCVP